MPKPKKARKADKRVLVFPVGKEPEIQLIDGKLESMQKIVGGYIEIVSVGDCLDLVCTEEGLITGLPLNRGLRGTFFIMRRDSEGDAVDMTDRDIADVQSNLNK